MVYHREKAENVNSALIGFLDQLENIGFDTIVIFGYRSPDEQNALYAQGRTAPGNIITNALPEQSAHCRGGAIDVMPYVDQKLVWDGPDVNYHLNEMAYLAKQLGLVWGGDWLHLKDLDHFEVANWKSLPYPMPT